MSGDPQGTARTYHVSSAHASRRVLATRGCGRRGLRPSGALAGSGTSGLLRAGPLQRRASLLRPDLGSSRSDARSVDGHGQRRVELLLHGPDHGHDDRRGTRPALPPRHPRDLGSVRRGAEQQTDLDVPGLRDVPATSSVRREAHLRLPNVRLLGGRPQDSRGDGTRQSCDSQGSVRGGSRDCLGASCPIVRGTVAS